jgi:hypothetical protein
MVEPGFDLHEWETEWAGLEESMADDPVGSLSEVNDLVTRMLEERGFPVHDPVAGAEGEEDEIMSAYRAAAEVTRLVDQDAEGISLGDVAAALENYRLVYESVIAQRAAP